MISQLQRRRDLWTMRATRRALHWEVRIVHDDPPHRLVWEATKGPFDAHATLTLVEAPHGRGTEVRLALGVRGPAVAVTLELWADAENDGEASCCSGP